MPININKTVIAVLAVGLVFLFLSIVGNAIFPFALAVVLAYIISPLANKIEMRGVTPAVTAGLLTLMVILLISAIPLALLPLIIKQSNNFFDSLPKMVEYAGNWLGEFQPHLLEQLQSLNPVEVTKQASDNINAEVAAKTASLAAGVFGKGVAAVVSFISIFLITPLAVFYFVRDRKTISGELTDVLPPHMRHQMLDVLSDLNGVLGEFMHGQVMVMGIMAAIYTLILNIAGLDFALTIGIISGILVFIPYVGFLIGLLLATIAGIGQFESWTDLILIWVLMGIGTTLESLFITPYLVGEKIGLHPLAILLALFIMGELLGFVGVLLALPLAAVVLVLSRHLRRYYINSDFYAKK